MTMEVFAYLSGRILLDAVFNAEGEPTVPTPKAFANFSPGLEPQRQPWDHVIRYTKTLKGFGNRGTF